MDALALLRHARAAGLEVRADGETLVVRGPKSCEDLAQQLLARKPEVLDALQRPALVEAAQALAPSIRLTIRATSDEASDRSFVAHVWALLREHEGHNLVFVRFVDEDGNAWRVRDRAFASAELRRRLAHLMAWRTRPHASSEDVGA